MCTIENFCFTLLSLYIKNSKFSIHNFSSLSAASAELLVTNEMCESHKNKRSRGQEWIISCSRGDWMHWRHLKSLQTWGLKQLPLDRRSQTAQPRCRNGERTPEYCALVSPAFARAARAHRRVFRCAGTRRGSAGTRRSSCARPPDRTYCTERWKRQKMNSLIKESNNYK